MNNRKFPWRAAALMIGGNLLYALSVKLFLLPANLMVGGTTGLSLMVNHFTGFSMSAFIMIFNLVMLAVGWFTLGKQFVMATVTNSMLYPVFLEMYNHLLGDVHITDNVMLSTLFAGMGLGLALGMMLSSGGSSGGVDIPLLILQKQFRIPVSVSLYVVDFSILMLQMFFHSVEDLLYGLLLTLAMTVVLNKTMVLGVRKTEVRIISPKSDEIRQAIFSAVDRGVTLINGEGGYSRQGLQIVMSVVSDRKVAKIERLVRSIDPTSFMVVSRVSEVWGRGFTLAKKSLEQQGGTHDESSSGK